MLFEFRYNNLLLIGLCFITALGAFLVLSRENPVFIGWGNFFLGLAAVIGMIYLKMLVRPHMAQQIIGLLFTGVLIFVFLWIPLWSAKQKTAGVLLLGLVMGLVLVPGSSSKHSFLSWTQGLLSERISYFSSFPKNVSTLLSDFSVDQKAVAQYFSKDNFSGLDQDQESVLDYLDSLKFEKQSANIYVLGDDSYFYILIQQRTPPYISHYDYSS